MFRSLSRDAPLKKHRQGLRRQAPRASELHDEGRAVEVGTKRVWRRSHCTAAALAAPGRGGLRGGRAFRLQQDRREHGRQPNLARRALRRAELGGPPASQAGHRALRAPPRSAAVLHGRMGSLARHVHELRHAGHQPPLAQGREGGADEEREGGAVEAGGAGAVPAHVQVRHQGVPASARTLQRGAQFLSLLLRPRPSVADGGQEVCGQVRNQ
mmetsp:Transcript_34074/g.98042  ORF Transcript_34074/g.98042 Transcript_34074/m.98042 type:complete len:213 (+) Transcript_34074:46-684(+)